MSFRQRKYPTFLEMLRNCGNVSKRALDGFSSCEKLTEAGAGCQSRQRSDVGKPTRTALHFGAQGASTSRGNLILRTAWKISFSTSSCMRTKCSGRTAMSWASRCTVRRNVRHGQHSFCWRSSWIASVPCVITKKEGVVRLYRKTRKKKCLFMVCCREHSAWWSALVKNVSQYCKAFNPMFSRTRRK